MLKSNITLIITVTAFAYLAVSVASYGYHNPSRSPSKIFNYTVNRNNSAIGFRYISRNVSLTYNQNRHTNFSSFSPTFYQPHHNLTRPIYLRRNITYKYYPAHRLQKRAISVKSHDLIIGQRLPGDQLEYQEHIYKKKSILGWIMPVKKERTFNVNGFHRITQIIALDQNGKGNGARAKVIGGGIGFNNVTIKFKAQRGHSIDFLIQIYTKSNY